ncbi:T9SS type A sorting domain-containing protein [Flavobacterium aciduliphilum]|uniref:Putative secreted protein (Por secretion system target) n=1 Tax=Flavobacterium aciduliphilum TaxID=1101402 RepID=A0A328YMM8_9FLAO|nr:T9SS type A sorting domain-containing protein [Flavobacterium aciduliphilum]RAR74095.1 putative secreted protein (Por secretion system target) [Flavobacterium aciduliphilum]
MIKKLFFALLLSVVSFSSNAQSIGLIGDFNSWASDVVMNTVDNTTYTVQYTFLITGGVKFRQDASWATNWGSSAFPSGTGVGGGPNIPVPAGTYNVTFNRTTGDYSFQTVVTNFDHIGFYGGFNSFATPGVDMVTTDGIAYQKIEYQFTADGVKFLKDNNTNQTWGGTAFPSGTATASGATIPLTAGFYNVDFNKNTLLYNFVQVPVALIGDGVSDWSTDVYMVSTDGGVTFTLTDVQLYSGSVKFRSNNSWANNWGGSAFPSGTGTLNSSSNIPTTPGIYTVTFNRITGDYSFVLTQQTVDQVQINGVNMNTSDGTSYTMSDFYVSTPGVTFANVTSSSTYGGSSYPAGTAVASASAIPVQVGYYNVTFNKTTLDYSFSVTPVAIIGDATAGGWSTETPMNTTDNGVNFTLSSATLTAGGLKFRSNNSWSIAWGNDTDFPSGIATTSAGNIPVVAGVYDISFNRTTGAYSFGNLATDSFTRNNLTLYPNPVNDMFTINGDFAKVEVYNIAGQLVKSFTASESYNVSELKTGIYFVKATDVNQKTSVAKVIKN